MSFKNIKNFSSLEHDPKSDKNASAFLKSCSFCVKSAKEIFFSLFIALNPEWVPPFKVHRI